MYELLSQIEDQFQVPAIACVAAGATLVTPSDKWGCSYSDLLAGIPNTAIGIIAVIAGNDFIHPRTWDDVGWTADIERAAISFSAELKHRQCGACVTTGMSAATWSYTASKRAAHCHLYDDNCQHLKTLFKQQGIHAVTGASELMGIKAADSIGHVLYESKHIVLQAWHTWAAALFHSIESTKPTVGSPPAATCALQKELLCPSATMENYPSLLCKPSPTVDTSMAAPSIGKMRGVSHVDMLAETSLECSSTTIGNPAAGHALLCTDSMFKGSSKVLDAHAPSNGGSHEGGPEMRGCLEEYAFPKHTLATGRHGPQVDEPSQMVTMEDTHLANHTERGYSFLGLRRRWGQQQHVASQTDPLPPCAAAACPPNRSTGQHRQIGRRHPQRAQWAWWTNVSTPLAFL